MKRGQTYMKLLVWSQREEWTVFRNCWIQRKERRESMIFFFLNPEKDVCGDTVLLGMR